MECDASVNGTYEVGVTADCTSMNIKMPPFTPTQSTQPHSCLYLTNDQALVILCLDNFTMRILKLVIVAMVAILTPPISATPLPTTQDQYLPHRARDTCPSTGGNAIAVKICTERAFAGSCHYHNPGPEGDSRCYSVTQASKFPIELTGKGNVQSIEPDPQTLCIVYRGEGCGEDDAVKAQYEAKGIVVDGNMMCPGRADIREEDLNAISFRCTGTAGRAEGETKDWLRKWNPTQ
ncbi:hypothetical protein EJ05DRAFT_326394 [Pseudovirgaria hyperparasitica]|uniref:Uncharacterized protein n=1 Tax=Pseudovirgaria hyperparasitica TaxID=470096 RepID=A0A6A6W7P7_9PEZI|nr:uncharacterized protein EJ05DRAFT_326394 [Pseudovirgaria hyperparasitica]KAF2758918.1 hypothetical protein EJ05DRAFT_326394 [Pseudovirgaria hyperparasitica]